MLFVELLNNSFIYYTNSKLIKQALADKRINKEQSYILSSNNRKWFETCNHKGLLFKENDKFYYVTRTSMNSKLELPNISYKITNKQYVGSYKKQYAEPIVFNNNCNIINKKWLLSNNDSINKVEYRSLEDRPEIVSKLVGTNEDLAKLKVLVKHLDLKEFDISPYFHMEKTIDELALLNIASTIRDE